MIALIFAIIFFILFVFFVIAGGNYILRKMIDNILVKTENFDNIDNKDNSIINPIDECKKLDERNYNNLNFQTATNIPLSPNYYKNYIGNIYMVDTKPVNELTKGKYCLNKGKLLYDGIWDPIINKEAPYEYETWALTNGNLTDGYYCSDKLIEVNKPFPKDYKDCSATPPITDSSYYTYFNDTQDDVFDAEISCFPSVFNAGITEDLKKKFKT